MKQLREMARCIAITREYVRARHERKEVEMLFIHLKRILKLDRLRLHGMSDQRDRYFWRVAALISRIPLNKRWVLNI